MSRRVGLYGDDGVVFNVVEFDPERAYNKPDDVHIIDDPNAEIGDMVVGGVLVPAPPPPPIEDLRTPLEKSRSEYPRSVVMMEAIYKQFSKMESEGAELHPDTQAVLDAIIAANQKYS